MLKDNNSVYYIRKWKKKQDLSKYFFSWQNPFPKKGRTKNHSPFRIPQFAKKVKGPLKISQYLLKLPGEEIFCFSPKKTRILRKDLKISKNPFQVFSYFCKIRVRTGFTPCRVFPCLIALFAVKLWHKRHRLPLQKSRIR